MENKWEHLKGIFEKSPIGVLFYDKEGNLVYANQSALNIGRVSQFKDIKGKNLFVNPDIESRKDELLKEGIIRFQSSIDLNEIKEQGFYTPTDFGIIYVDHTVSVTDFGFLMQTQDITGRKKAERLLKESEEKFRSFYELPLIGIGVNSPDKGWVEANDKLCEILGYSREELFKTTWDKITYPDDLDKDLEQFNKLLNGYIDSYTLEKRFIRKNGSVVYTNISIGLIRNEDNSVKYSVGFTEDITDRKRIENIIQARSRLLEFANSHSTNELLTAALDEIEALTGSNIGFYHFLKSDQKTLTLQNWSTNTLKNMCTADGKGSHYNIDQAGVWVDCVYERRPVIHNDYASLPHRKGLPEGHAPVIRELVVPIFRGKLIKAIIGVGNKPADYDENDIEIVSQLGDLSWDIVERKKVEENIQMLANVVESSDDAIISKSLEGRIISWNKGAESIYGYSAPEVMGKDISILAPPKLRDEIKQLTEKVKRGEHVLHYETIRIRKDNEKIYVSLTLSPIFDVSGNLIGISTIARDITERKNIEEELRKAHIYLEEQVEERTNELKNAYKELEERQKRFSSLVSASSELLYRVSPDWSEMRQFTSRGFLAKMEKPSRTWLWDYIPLEDQPRVTAAINEAMRTKSIYELEHRIKLADGSVGWIFSRAVPIIDKNGEIVEWFGAASDITKRKIAENELKKALNGIKRSNEELEQFAYVASHDLQEPLRTIASFTQLLERRYKGKLDSDADEFMEYIVDAAVRMKQQIQDLLEYSRVATAGKEFEQVDTDSILNQVITNLKSAIDENNAEITHEPLPKVTGNSNQLMRVFQNLISNAIKYRKPDEPPKIHISVHEDKEKGEYVFSVSDNGIGIKKEYLDRIFMVFQRLHTMDEYKGTGIGLSVVKKVIERHGGHIWVESEYGKGSTFYFTIPFHVRQVNLDI